MAHHYEVPTMPGRPFSERFTIGNTTHSLYFCWNWVAQCWVVDIFNEAATTALIRGVPLVTGCDLLEQFGYLEVGTKSILTVMCIGPDVSPDTIPTFTNLGTDGHVFITVP